MIDGRHTGTGGGNHIVIGGADAGGLPDAAPAGLACAAARLLAESSVAVLAVFSGLFIGPTSQAPRIDEARNDSLYELEIAFSAGAGRGYGWIRPGWWTGSSAIC